METCEKLAEIECVSADTQSYDTRKSLCERLGITVPGLCKMIRRYLSQDELRRYVSIEYYGLRKKIMYHPEVEKLIRRRMAAERVKITERTIAGGGYAER